MHTVEFWGLLSQGFLDTWPDMLCHCWCCNFNYVMCIYIYIVCQKVNEKQIVEARFSFLNMCICRLKMPVWLDFCPVVGWHALWSIIADTSVKTASCSYCFEFVSWKSIHVYSHSLIQVWLICITLCSYVGTLSGWEGHLHVTYPSHYIQTASQTFQAFLSLLLL